MYTNFIELSSNELLNIDGGTNWLKVIGGGLICVGAIVALPEEITIGAGVAAGVAIIGGIGCIIDGI